MMMRIMIMMMCLAVVLLVSGSATATRDSERNAPLKLRTDVAAIIQQWAPLIWLHPDELFFPSSVDFHFENVEVRDENETLIQAFPDRYTVVTGEETNAYHLNSVPDLECGDCLLPWFVGQNISEIPVPTYVFVKDYQDACGTVDVAYRSFYPYNYGKDVCVGIPSGQVCEGAMQSFGNHVGDWEHYSIRIKNGSVTDCYVSVHSFGAYYAWNETEGLFQLVRGEQKINLVNVTYPQTVQVVDGFHAELFSANGSHGLWSAPGTHEYVHFPIQLQDQAERGYAWRTWDFLEVVEWNDQAQYVDELHYLDYRGRWGNQEMGCGIIESVSGECILGNGPRLWPAGPRDFPDDCPLR